MQINLGETIRNLRHRDGRTQEVLANALGVHHKQFPVGKLTEVILIWKQFHQ